MKKPGSVEYRGSSRRKHRRFDVRIRVDVSTSGMFLSYRMSNLSRGGFFMEMDDPYPLMSEVRLAFVLPGMNAVIRGIGTVVWNYDIQKGSSHISPGAGIQFKEMSPEHRRLLGDYLAHLSGLNQNHPEGAPAPAAGRR
jgi:uncharacterized protein (TIGR02266 family)